MQLLRNNTYLYILAIVTILFVAILSVNTVWSRTVQDIQKEIDQKKNEVESVTSTVSTLEGELGKFQEQFNAVAGKREKLRIQIEINKKETEILKAKIEDTQEKKLLTELEKERRIVVQDNIIKDAYLLWKQSSPLKPYLSGGAENLFKISTYQMALANDERTNINNLALEIADFQKKLDDSEKQKAEYENKITELASQIIVIQEELAGLDTKIKANQGDIANYRGKIGEIQSQIDQLTKEQKEIQEKEARMLGKASNGGTKPIKPGQIYFQGVGREAYQGHGVGMSQFGALGAAMKGWDYKKILTFYYPGTEVVTFKARDKIEVSGYGTMSIEDYVAGAGEVPDYSCEDLDIEFDESNIWKCWPEEAIKAQAVAFRTYGINKTQGGGSICTTAACQVYKGGENKRWASEDTEFEVVVYNGEPISAFYSSDNHNGWGTANNDTVWSNLSGDGTPVPYLRAVNDSDTTFKYTYTSWTWRTNGYSLSDVDTMLDWTSTSDGSSGRYKEFVATLKQNIGVLQEISFERDPSGRVAKVILNGSKGKEEIAGWLFKSIWNIWIGTEKPSGELDYIYSLTYYLVKG